MTSTLAALAPSGRWSRRFFLVAVAVVVLGLVLVGAGFNFPGAAAIGAGSALLGLVAPAVAVWLLVILLPVHPFAMRVAFVDLGFSGREFLLLSAWKEIALGAIVVSVGIASVRRGLPREPRSFASRVAATDVMAAALVFIVALGLVVSPTVAAINQVRLLLFPLVLYFVFRTGMIPARGLPFTLVVATALIALFGVLQSTFFGWDWVVKYYGTPGLPVPWTFGASGVDGARAAGTLASPNEFAFVVGIGLIMALVLSARRRDGATPGFALLIACLAAGLALSFSRSTQVAVGLAAVTLVASALVRHPWDRQTALRVLTVATPGLALALMLFVSRGGLDLAASTVGSAPTPTPTPVTTPLASGPPTSSAPTSAPTPAPAVDPSSAGHVNSIRQSISLIRDHPLGLGLGVVGARTVPGDTSSEPLIVESWYLSLGLILGLPGLVWAVLIPFVFWRRGLSVLRRAPPAALTVVGATTVVAITGLVLPTMLEPHVAYLPWVLVTFAAGAAWTTGSAEATATTSEGAME